MVKGEPMTDIIAKVHEANKSRTMDIFDRRVIKLGEEYGEACQAFLSVSSENNSKNKSWPDVREELVDVVIVALDLLLHEMPDESNTTLESKAAAIHSELDRKLRKWHKKQKRKDDVSNSILPSDQTGQS